MHYIKIAHNVYVIYKFIENLRYKLTSNPLQSLSAYLTITLYFGFLFINVSLLSENVPMLCLTILTVYPATDWSLCLASVIALRPVI